MSFQLRSWKLGPSTQKIKVGETTLAIWISPQFNHISVVIPLDTEKIAQTNIRVFIGTLEKQWACQFRITQQRTKQIEVQELRGDMKKEIVHNQ